MQAFAISVVLMSSACGQGAAPVTEQQEPGLAALVRTIDCRSAQPPYVASFVAERYDSGKGDRHVPPLSGRSGTTSSWR